MINKLKREVRIVGGVAKIVETKEGKIINIIKDLKKHKPLEVNISEKFSEHMTGSFSNIADRFCDNIKEFIDKYGNKYYKHFHYNFAEFDLENKEMSNNKIEYHDHFQYRKKMIFKGLEPSSRILRHIISNYILTRFHLISEIGQIKIPFCENESNVDDWFTKNCDFFGINIKEVHRDGIDYLCEYNFDPLILCIISKDEKVYDFFDKFIKRDKRTYNIQYLQIELEYQSSNFIMHKHPINLTDMVICFKKDRNLDIPILELYPWADKPDYDIIETYNSICSIESLIENYFLHSKIYEREELIRLANGLLFLLENSLSIYPDKNEKIKELFKHYKIRTLLEILIIEKVVTKEYMESIVHKGIINPLPEDIVNNLLGY